MENVTLFLRNGRVAIVADAIVADTIIADATDVVVISSFAVGRVTVVTAFTGLTNHRFVTLTEAQSEVDAETADAIAEAMLDARAML